MKHPIRALAGGAWLLFLCGSFTFCSSSSDNGGGGAGDDAGADTTAPPSDDGSAGNADADAGSDAGDTAAPPSDAPPPDTAPGLVTLMTDGFEGESGPYCTGWVSGGTIVTAPVHRGAQACQFCANAAGASIIYPITGAATAGSYDVYLSVYSATGGGTVSVTLGFLGPQTKYVPIVTSPAMPVGTFLNVHGNVAVPKASAGGVQVEVKLDGAKVGDCFRMDDVRLTVQ